MSYQVLSRKYRPQTFDDVFGQEHVAATLRNAIESDRLAHAYLFCGPRGVGKTTLARILAKAVNCLETPGPNPCGACEACRGIAAGGDVDVLEIDAASNRGVADVEPLIDATRYLPQRSARKVFIVDEVHMLSSHAFNALLKTLEEPPPHVLFLFATTEPQKMPATVRSRCQRFDLRRISSDDIVAKLRSIAEAEGAAVDDAVLAQLAERATGGLRDAESLLDQILSAAPAGRPLAADDLLALLGDIPREVRDAILAAAHGGDMPGVLDAAAGVVEAGADPGALLRELYGDVRDHAVARARGDGGEPGVEWCLAAAEILARHQRLAAESRAARATLDLALLALARLGDVADLEAMVDRLERLSGGAPAAAPAPVARPQVAPAAAAPTAGGAPRRLEIRRRPLEAGAPPADNERPKPPARAPRAGGGSLGSEELARIKGLPRVREITSAFGGHVENVTRESVEGVEDGQEHG